MPGPLRAPAAVILALLGLAAPPGPASAVLVPNKRCKTNPEDPICEDPHNLAEDWSLRGKFDHILLYAMGKTGSSSMMMSLQLDYVDARSGGVYNAEGHKLDSVPSFVKTHSYEVAMAFDATRRPGNVLVLGLVRNPFVQLQSLFFEHTTCCYPDLKWAEAKGRLTLQDWAAEFEKHVSPSQYHDWWSRNFANVSGVDFDELHYVKGKKQAVAQASFRGGETNVTVVALRLEDIDYWQKTMEQYIPQFVPVPNNMRKTKVYASTLDGFSRQYRYTLEAVQTIQSSDSYRFYSEVEQNAFEHLAAGPRPALANVSELMARAGARVSGDYLLLGGEMLYLGDPDPDMVAEYL